MIRDIALQKLLFVDLNQNKTWTEELPADDLSAFLGGRGINAKLLYTLVKKGTDPLGPDNVLIFGTGTLSGTGAPCSGRTTVTSKSPATGRYVKTSVGGHWGAELKYAGFDYIIVMGKADTPVYLWICDAAVEIRPCNDMWGKGTRETDTILKNELGSEEIQTAVIGPAGENLVNFSNIMFSRFNSASRGGIGTVMGSKKFKAIAVRGSGGLKLSEGEPFFDLAKTVRQAMANDPLGDALYRWGTAGQIAPLNEQGSLASFNFSKTGLEGAERIGGQYWEDEGYLTGRESCFACSIACHRYVRSKHHVYGEISDTGPELETAQCMGAQCGMVDTEGLLKANAIANDLGLDTISSGHVISWAMETAEKNLFASELAEGQELRFGDVEGIHKLLKKIAYRDGALGNLLADGTKKAAEKVGGDSRKWAIQARGLEMSAADTRSAKGYALAFALNPRGPDHLHTECLAEFGMTPEARELVAEITGDEKYAVPHLVEKRPEIVTWHEDCYAASDALGFCVFTSTALYNVNPDIMAQWWRWAIGKPITDEELLMAGRRIVTLERCFNIREGFCREDDILPWRMMNDPISDGPATGMVTDKEMLKEMLERYYSLNGWEVKTGIPTKKTIEYLGLGDICGDAVT